MCIQCEFIYIPVRVRDRPGRTGTDARRGRARRATATAGSSAGRRIEKKFIVGMVRSGASARTISTFALTDDDDDYDDYDYDDDDGRRDGGSSAMGRGGGGGVRRRRRRRCRISFGRASALGIERRWPVGGGGGTTKRRRDEGRRGRFSTPQFALRENRARTPLLLSPP